MKFENGFDIPTNGTVILGVNQVVSGPINFNNGTIILEKNITLGEDVTFNGLGYIKTNTYTIYLQGGLNSSDDYFFSDQVTFHGLGIGELALRSGSHLLLTDNNITFKEMRVLLREDRFIFNGVGDRALNLFGTYFDLVSGDITFDNLRVDGRSFLRGRGSTYTVLDIVHVNGGSQLMIDNFIKLSTPQILLAFDLSELFLL